MATILIGWHANFGISTTGPSKVKDGKAWSSIDKGTSGICKGNGRFLSSKKIKLANKQSYRGTDMKVTVFVCF